MMATLTAFDNFVQCSSGNRRLEALRSLAPCYAGLSPNCSIDVGIAINTSNLI
ncbi:MAG: hypothetical protein AAF915_01600 [Cyanobacteria bacterium P01_D01_bin.50]